MDPDRDLHPVAAGDLAFPCLDRGAGDPVVLVHGGASDARTWTPLVPTLAASHRAIAYSRRFAWPNPPLPPDADDPIATHVADLAALLAALGAAPAHLVGHSWGGLVALLTAMRHPDLVRSLVLIEPPALTLFVSVPPRPRELARLALRRPGAALAIVAFGARAIAPTERAFRRGDDDAALTAFGRGILGPRAFAALTDERRAQVRANLATDRALMLRGGWPRLDADELAALATPTLLLVGDRSPSIFRHLAAGLRDTLPRADLVPIAGTSHLVHEDAPTATATAINTFLAAHA